MNIASGMSEFEYSMLTARYILKIRKFWERKIKKFVEYQEKLFLSIVTEKQ